MARDNMIVSLDIGSRKVAVIAGKLDGTDKFKLSVLEPWNLPESVKAM